MTIYDNLIDAINEEQKEAQSIKGLLISLVEIQRQMIETFKKNILNF